jgi:LysR family transcriptional regulator, glycine cleavage system transcriptional activator
MGLDRLSLNALRAFEATARLRSFSAAADELSVTHGAVSRHVRMLEDTLGLPLLKRNAHGTEPTAEGERLAEGLLRGFQLIRASVEQLEPGPLTLSCSESIMMYWLLPRLARFQEANPDVELRFNMGYGPVDFARDNIGVAIRLSTIEPPKDVIRTEPVTEWIGPVCSPAYLQTLRLTAPADLPRARLMVSRTRPRVWEDWSRACGADLGELPVAESFNHFYLLIQAAKCGLGMANVPRMLVRDDLNSGTLVAPLGFLAGPNKLSVWVAPLLSRRSDTVRLVDWLTEELRTSERPLPAGGG